ncbi:hypothetical protein D5E69_15870 [Rossellomorea marisflavi]|uniref:hypothetical protein n=1 Tax=Rossellomorea marisflavi TaxID=189381 RepID=UPI001318DFC5|nr:hypothetical protein [Rossellomorea marisflavi]QHA37142.1 hypothetical protein D5E69_15870 [Rossellomorea marisflavi]
MPAIWQNGSGFNLFHDHLNGFQRSIGVQDEASCGIPQASLEEAQGLPAESEVLHGTHERYKEPIRIVFVMKWSLFHFVQPLFRLNQAYPTFVPFSGDGD